jgi:GMC oxidoreductase/FAD dependent oxidoreductase
MLVNESDVAESGAEPFSVAIIGAGVVGVFCAVQLERRGLRVALIEGGDVTPDTLSNARYTEIAGRAHSTVDSGRAMGLGGTGLLWGGQLSEFSAADVAGDKGFWPISHAELRALYDRVYATLGLPPRMDNATARALFGGDEGIVDDVERIFSYWLPNPNLVGVFREIISRSPALAVFTRCKAVGLSFDENGRACRVRVRTPSGPAAIAADRVVIAGGVVESARFALAARREENCPWRDNARIGVAFQDHIGGELGALIVKNERLFRDRFETGFSQKTKYMPKLRFVGAGERPGSTLSVCAFPSFRSNISEHIANIKLLMKAVRSGSTYTKWRELPASVMKIGVAFFPLIQRYVRERRVLAMMDQGVDLAFQCEQIPRPDSRITLADRPDASDGLPPVVVDWRTGSDEPAFLRASASRFAYYFDHTSCAELRINPALFDDAPAFFSHMRDTSHPGGGLCMSRDPASGATDPDGRIWGSPNVYAAGGSALATSGEANITLTALALALRLTDRLAAARGEVEQAQAGRDHAFR